MDEPSPPAADPAHPPLPPAVDARCRDLEGRIAQNPKGKALYLQLAQLYQDNKRRDLALDVLRRCLQVDPGNVTVRSKIEILLRLESPPRAAATSVSPQPDAERPGDEESDLSPIEATRRGGRLLTSAVAVTVAIPLLFGLKALLLPSTRRLVTVDGSISCPRFSPDGTRVAYIASSGGDTALYVVDVRRREARKLCPILGYGGDFCWSPDSQKIALEAMDTPGEDDSDEGGDGFGLGNVIKVIDVAGGRSANVGQGTNPTWAPGGVELAFLADPTFEQMRSESFEYDRRPIAMVNVITRAVRTITRHGGESLIFSPRGDTLLFEVHEPGGFEPRAEDAARVEERRDDLASVAENALSTGAKNEGEAHRGFTRELEARQHERERQGGGDLSPHIYTPTNIYRVSVPDGHVAALTTDRLSTSPVWSPDGDTVLYVNYPRRDHPELWLMNDDGSGQKPALAEKTTARVYDPNVKAFLPGRRIVFSGVVGGVDAGAAQMTSGQFPADLFLAEVGTDARRIANKHAFKHDASVAADGSRIVYVVRDPDGGKSELYVMKLR